MFTFYWRAPLLLGAQSFYFLWSTTMFLIGLYRLRRLWVLHRRTTAAHRQHINLKQRWIRETGAACWSFGEVLHNIDPYNITNNIHPAFCCLADFFFYGFGLWAAMDVASTWLRLLQTAAGFAREEERVNIPIADRVMRVFFVTSVCCSVSCACTIWVAELVRLEVLPFETNLLSIALSLLAFAFGSLLWIFYVTVVLSRVIRVLKAAANRTRDGVTAAKQQEMDSLTRRIFWFRVITGTPIVPGVITETISALSMIARAKGNPLAPDFSVPGSIQIDTYAGVNDLFCALHRQAYHHHKPTFIMQFYISAAFMRLLNLTSYMVYFWSLPAIPTSSGESSVAAKNAIMPKEGASLRIFPAQNVEQPVSVDNDTRALPGSTAIMLPDVQQQSTECSAGSRTGSPTNKRSPSHSPHNSRSAHWPAGHPITTQSSPHAWSPTHSAKSNTPRSLSSRTTHIATRVDSAHKLSDIT